MKVRVFYHDRCFDGTSSAALFSRFYRERIRPDVEFVYTGLVHRAGALFDEAHFDGDENAIVDFKYSTSPKVTWWFDHHQSAFLTPDDAAHFEQQQSNRKFYDPDFRSCTKFIASVAEHRFGFDPAPVAELVEWADIIDGALVSQRSRRRRNARTGHEADHGHRSYAGLRVLAQAHPAAGLPAVGGDHSGAIRG